MDLLELLMLLVIVGICGAIAQWVVAVPITFPVTIIVGVIGAYLGASLANLLRFPHLVSIAVGTVEFDLIWAIIGSMLLLLLLKLLRTSGPQWLNLRR